MRKVLAVSMVMGMALVMPGPASAKPGTAKIVITGGRLAQPLEVTNTDVLKHFSVWHGYLGGSGLATAPSGNSNAYEVRFHVKFSDMDVRMAYVAYYHPRPAGERGYFYLPRRGEKWHDFNASTIRQRTGWWRASPEWDALIKPLIEAAEAAQPR